MAGCPSNGIHSRWGLFWRGRPSKGESIRGGSSIQGGSSKGEFIHGGGCAQEGSIQGRETIQGGLSNRTHPRGGGIASRENHPRSLLREVIQGDLIQKGSSRGFHQGDLSMGSTKGYIREGPINKSPSYGSLFNGAPMHMPVWQCRITTYWPPKPGLVPGRGLVAPHQQDSGRRHPPLGDPPACLRGQILHPGGRIQRRGAGGP